MSNPSETSGRPLESSTTSSSLQQSSTGSTQPSLPSPPSPPSVSSRKHQNSPSSVQEPEQQQQQQPVHKPTTTTTTTTTRRRGPAARSQTTRVSPHATSTRDRNPTMQRSTSPTQSAEAPPVNYTRTGRISKAKKGLKVHNCECGRSYTRAEHLRRHQKNHNPDSLICNFPDCGKTFHRPDLLQRHQERHNEPTKDPLPSPYRSTPGPGSEPHTSASIPGSVAPHLGTTFSPTPYFTTTTMSPVPPVSSPESSMKPQFPHHAQHRMGTMGSAAIPVEGSHPNTSMAWTDPFAPDTSSLSSSGYASPIPSVGDFPHVFPPYGDPVRTRTSSNASMFDQPWPYHPHSPPSATSNMPYHWPPGDKSPAPPNLALLTMTGAPHYHIPAGPMAPGGVPELMMYRSRAQRDAEEQAQLFPSEHQFGMEHIRNTCLESYLDVYWRIFHPSFPVVHRPTFDPVTGSPMLRATMIAIGAQYSDDSSIRRKSRILIDRCSKLLDERETYSFHDSPRLCDYQAIFLLEFLQQYRARRQSPSLSRRFEDMYIKFSRIDSSKALSDIVEGLYGVDMHSEAVGDHWTRWIDVSSHQRLLLGCYVLEYQQATLLARSPRPSKNQSRLPFPAPVELWEATNPTEWAVSAMQCAHLPDYLDHPTSLSTRLDAFQSHCLIALNYNHFDCQESFLWSLKRPDVDNLLDPGPITKHHLLTAKLLQVTPIRALLAVSGESWILFEKVATSHLFATLRTALKEWMDELWNTHPESRRDVVQEALSLSIEILRHALITPANELLLELGADMGVYYAVLVVWASTVAASNRVNRSPGFGQLSRHNSPRPYISQRPGPYTSSPKHLKPNATNAPGPLHLTPICSSPINMEVVESCLQFLDKAANEVEMLNSTPQWPRDVAQWQQGCTTLMRWVITRLHKGSPEGHDSVISTGPTSAATSGRGGECHGELLKSVDHMFKKVLQNGWEGWW